MDSVAILDRLIGFPTVSRDSNLDLIGFVREVLDGYGVGCRVLADATGGKASLFATVGPEGPDGVVLSGHTDVVPVDGQAWSGDPFRMREQDGRLYGRGAADMKGFVACAIRAAGIAARRRLRRPLHLALSYDEEVGCLGVRGMLDQLSASGFRAAFCVVGEPTGMAVMTGHKGKTDALVTCCGEAAHSAFAPRAQNAIHLAAELIGAIRAIQAEIAGGRQDGAYAVPYTTLHVGRIDGGVALNIVPERCAMRFEVRTVGGDDGAAVLDRVRAAAADLVVRARQEHAAAAIGFEVTNAYPALETAEAAPVVAAVRALLPEAAGGKVDFGTEAGLFAARLGLDCVICGPGRMAQGHRADEYVDRSQLRLCDAMLEGVVAGLG